MNNFIVGYNKMILTKTAMFFSVIEKKINNIDLNHRFL